MAKATWNGATIVESNDFLHVEGNVYFPLSAINKEYLSNNEKIQPTYCHWKGFAKYFDVTVEGKTNEGGAWYYEEPYPQAAVIKGHVAFWNGIEVSGAPEGDGLVEGEPRLDGKIGWEALCWLIKFSENEVISVDEVKEVTGIAEGALSEAWQIYDVQRYADRYERKLVGGRDEPLQIVRR